MPRLLQNIIAPGVGVFMRLGFIKSIFHKIDTLVTGRGRIDEELFEELESALLQADVNIHTTTQALEDLRTAVRENRLKEVSDVKLQLQQSLGESFERAGPAKLNFSSKPPTCIVVVGVNGVGKTTTIAKLAYKLHNEHKRVLLAAADTFRAAAIEQLEIWGNRVGVDVIKHADGSDPSGVVFDAIAAAKARGSDVVIVDTAGRLHTKHNLMDELRKTLRVTEKALGRPPDEVLLVLDATTGQNGVSQAKVFREAAPLTGLVLAKLDGTARGGIVLTIADELGLPIKLIGVGEKMGDLMEFNPAEFVESLLA
jgi:fused signal recognition particle receptor